MMLALFKNMTILKGYSLIYLVCFLIYTIAKWETLSHGEGWGVVYMVGLITIGLFGLGIDFAMRLLIKNKKILNAIGITTIILFSIGLWTELK